MPAVKTIRSRTVALPATNIDTDQIIPARFLTSTSKAGFGKHLFADWRYDAAGNPKPDFVLNKPEAQGAAHPRRRPQHRLRVARANTRPGRCRISASRPSSAPSSPTSSAPTASRTACCPWSSTRRRTRGCSPTRVSKSPSTSKAPRSRCPTARQVKFPLEGFARYCLLNGVDELGFLLSQNAAISAYEQSHR